MSTRLDRVVGEANTGLEAVVESVSRPILRELEHRQADPAVDVGTELTHLPSGSSRC
ncbi:MAG: hypothetical protein P8L16_11475 [Ilumatobacter sp.]|uniref:hypothetical protein n=1 Tax=Ilumatobacter sp. TaxID=1967498 RepID=UPI002A2E8126|nr:hypothetical protein [Ilumatobacter sp.]MDG2234440.1 hypothetical protein [Ilumatobacter sp.]